MKLLTLDKGSSGRLFYLDRWILIISVLWALMFAWLSVAQYNAYNDGWSDFAFMAQSIWSATQGQPLVHTSPLLGQSSRLNVHVELIYLLLAIPYKLWPDPRLLLAAQGALFGLGGIPLYSLAKRCLQHELAALMLTSVYWFYPVAHSAVLYGLHGDTLAMPFLLLALNALGARRWKAYVLGLVLALCCRFYIAAPVGVLGLVLISVGDRRYGLSTLLGATLWGLFAYFVIRPFFARFGSSEHMYVTSLGYARFYFAGMLEALSTSYASRIATAVVVFLPVFWLARYDVRWVLPALSIALPALVSSGPNHSFSIRYHHYASAVPFLLLAAIEGASTLRLRQGDMGRLTIRSWRGQVFLVLATTIMFSAALGNTPFSFRFWGSSALLSLDPLTYGRTSRDKLKDQWLPRVVPSQARLAASTFLVSHFPNRWTLYDVVPEDLNKIDYALLDALFDHPVLIGEDLVSVMHDVPSIAALMQSDDFGLVAQRDGLLLFAGNPGHDAILKQDVHAFPESVGSPPVVVDNPIMLVEARLESTGERRYVLRCSWQPLEPLAERDPLLAVSKIEGIQDARVVHLPSFVLYPTTEWELGETVQELIEFDLPDDVLPGEYELSVAWYDTAHPSVYLTDNQSMVGEETVVGALSVH